MVSKRVPIGKEVVLALFKQGSNKRTGLNSEGVKLIGIFRGLLSAWTANGEEKVIEYIHNTNRIDFKNRTLSSSKLSFPFKLINFSIEAADIVASESTVGA
jgi:hypothetical protein